MKKILLVLLVLPIFNFGQELDATVIVNNEQLSIEAKERLVNFRRSVEDYLNNTKFTETMWEGAKIPCTFNIFFTNAGGETSYSTQIVITSQRPVENSEKRSLMLSILDNSWEFNYEKNQPFYFNPTTYDRLVSFLDFYAYLIIGFDMDSYYELGGTENFNKAYNIALLGANSTSAEPWLNRSQAYNKRVLVENLLNVQFQQFRIDYFYYHYNGLDLYNVPEEKEEAVKNIVSLIANLEKVKGKIDPRNVLLKVFFDAKSAEIIEYLGDYEDKSVFEALKKIDASHSSKYNEALKRFE